MKKKVNFAVRTILIMLIVISSIMPSYATKQTKNVSNVTTSVATKMDNTADSNITNSDETELDNATCDFLEINNNIEEEKYYYQQLTEEEKTIYDWLDEQREALLSLKEVKLTIGQYNSQERDYYISIIKRAKDAYIRDTAEAKIFLQNYKIYLNCSNEARLILRPCEGAESSKKILEEFEEKAKEIAKDIQGNTEEEKLQQINNYLIENVSYDYSYVLDNTHNAYGALINGEAVCDGYATAFKYIADLCGLKTIYVQGKVSDLEHAWNMVYIEGEWLIIDATFNYSTKTNRFFLFSPTGLYKPDTRFTYI